MGHDDLAGERAYLHGKELRRENVVSGSDKTGDTGQDNRTLASRTLFLFPLLVPDAIGVL